MRVRNALQRESQGSLNNLLSGLPQGPLVDEHLNKCMKKGDLALLLVSLGHFDAFREAYGFVASDDVLRAFSLILVNTMRELNGGDDFLGQIGQADFVPTVALASLSGLYEHRRSCLDQSLDYFYPIKDREPAAKREDRLTVRMSDMPLAAGGRISTAEPLKVELLRKEK